MASIQDIRSVETPQRAYEWEVELNGGSTSGNLPILTQRAQNVSIPEISVETIEINYKSRKSLYAGRDASPHTVTVTFWDSESHDVYNFFRDWIAGISDPFQGGGDDRGSYAAEMIIRKFAHDSTTETGKNVFTKVFPTSLGEVSLNYEGSEHMTFDVTFSYDENVSEGS